MSRLKLSKRATNMLESAAERSPIAPLLAHVGDRVYITLHRHGLVKGVSTTRASIVKLMVTSTGRLWLATRTATGGLLEGNLCFQDAVKAIWASWLAGDQEKPPTLFAVREDSDRRQMELISSLVYVEGKTPCVADITGRWVLKSR